MKCRNPHPGEILLKDFLEPMGISQRQLAAHSGMTPVTISAICRGNRSITPDSAIRLSRALGTSYKLWMGLQADYDEERLLITKDYSNISRMEGHIL